MAGGMPRAGREGRDRTGRPTRVGMVEEPLEGSLPPARDCQCKGSLH